MTEAELLVEEGNALGHAGDTGDAAGAERAYRAALAGTACEMDAPCGDGPPDFGFGSIPVRLDRNGQPEVVWAHRIDPARPGILSVPLPTSLLNFGAVVLTDAQLGSLLALKELGRQHRLAR